MRSVGSHSTSGREKEGRKEGNGGKAIDCFSAPPPNVKCSTDYPYRYKACLVYVLVSAYKVI